MDITNKLMLGSGAAIAGCVFWLFLSNAHLKAQVAEARTQALACRMANDDFAAAALRQNLAVEKLYEESAGRIKRARDAAQEAQGKARLFYVAAEKLRKTKTAGDACVAADALFNSYLEGQK